MSGPSPEEIAEMANRIEDGIRTTGWTAELEGATQALQWVLGEPHARRQLDRFLAAPEDQRRQDWIARGGNPDHWPRG